MSQCIVCQNGHGIVLAVDSEAVVFDITGKPQHRQINRMLPLTQHTVILTGGAADGADMCQRLKAFVEEEGINDVEEIYQACLPFLATAFERFMRERCEIIPLDPALPLCFILGGVTKNDVDRPFRLYLIWTKKKLPRLDGEEIGAVYTIPRVMTLEYRLNQLCKTDTSLEKMAEEVGRAMENQSKGNDDIGPPFHVGLVTGEGFTLVS